MNKTNEPPPNGMTMTEVPAYVASRMGKVPSFQTVYNWTSKGVKGEKLKIVFARGRAVSAGVFADTRYTTPEWVDEFLARVG